MKCFIDSLKDCRPLLSKFIRVNVVFCKTEGLACSGEQNLETAKCVFLPYHKMIKENQVTKVTIHIFFQLSNYKANLVSFAF